MDRQMQDQMIQLQNDLVVKDRVIARTSTERERLVMDIERFVQQYNELNVKYQDLLAKYEELTMPKDLDGEAGKED